LRISEVLIVLRFSEFSNGDSSEIGVVPELMSRSELEGSDWDNAAIDIDGSDHVGESVEFSEFFRGFLVLALIIGVCIGINGSSIRIRISICSVISGLISLGNVDQNLIVLSAEERAEGIDNLFSLGIDRRKLSKFKISRAA
jgi:hypothetical protein